MFYYIQLPNPIKRLVPRGGGGTTLYKSYRYVPPHWVGFLGQFGLKTGKVFEGTTECIIVFIISIPNEKERKKEKYVNSKWI